MSKIVNPVKYPGSKYNLSKQIINLISPHKCFVEVFGGSGIVLLAKPRSEVEVYNDLSKHLVTLFRTIRGNREALYDKLKYTLYSREEWEQATQILREHSYEDELQHAWAAFVAYNQSMGGVVSNRGGWGYGITGNTTGGYYRRIYALEAMQKRLEGVYIENLDFREVIKKYDSPATYFYLDPPYVMETRRADNAYFHEMTELDHIDLVLLLLDIQGKMTLSGYDHPVYKPLEKRYRRIEVKVRSTMRADGKNVERVEVLWTSTLHDQLSLFA